MMSFSRSEKTKHNNKQSIRSDGKSKPTNRPVAFISMNEARQIAEHVFSGIAWIG